MDLQQLGLLGSVVKAGVSNYLSTIRFKTRNCGGIGGLEKKRRELFDNLRHNNDVIVLTETKFKKSKEDTYRQEWKQDAREKENARKR